MQRKRMASLKYLWLVFFLVPLTQLEANNSIQDTWIAVFSPVKVGAKSELRKKTRLWLHRPSQASFVDVTEEYLPGLPESIRLETYCRDLKDQFKKVDSYKFNSKSCVVMGSFMDKPTIQGAFLEGTRNVRHFVSDLSETKFDKLNLEKDLEELMKRRGSLK
jgi:hypothetical protein